MIEMNFVGIRAWLVGFWQSSDNWTPNSSNLRQHWCQRCVNKIPCSQAHSPVYVQSLGFLMTVTRKTQNKRNVKQMKFLSIAPVTQFSRRCGDNRLLARKEEAIVGKDFGWTRWRRRSFCYVKVHNLRRREFKTCEMNFNQKTAWRPQIISSES